jgi:hypothetical protein
MNTAAPSHVHPGAPHGVATADGPRNATNAGAHAVLADIRLGDVICLPDGREMTARSKVALPMPLGSMAGFVIAGELEALVSTPSTTDGPYTLYAPVNDIPDIARRARPVYSGACSYWSPHLPAKRQAMGELLYRVAEVRGSLDPLVVVWRSREPVVFVRESQVPAGSLSVLYMPRDAEDVSDVARHTATVNAPITAPAPQVPLYERVIRS